MIKNKLYLKKSEMLIFFLVFSFIKPGLYEEIWLLDVFSNFCRLISSLIIIYTYIVNRKKMSNTFFILGSMYIIILFFTVINKASYHTFITKCIFPMVVFLFFSCYISEIETILRIIIFWGEIYTYINFLTLIAYRDGIYQRIHIGNSKCWFLGQKNEFMYFFLIFAVCSELYKMYSKSRVRSLILNIIMIVSAVLSNSINVLFVLVLFHSLCFFYKYYKLKIINSIILFIGNVILWFTVTFESIYLPVFDKILNVFGKNITFSGRTIIWERLIELMQHRILWGYGTQGSEQTISLIGVSYALNIHNTVLQYLFYGGLITVILFIIFNIHITKKLYIYKNFQITKIMCAALFCLNIFCVFESQYNGFIYVLYALADNVEYIVSYTTDNLK